MREDGSPAPSASAPPPGRAACVLTGPISRRSADLELRDADGVSLAVVRSDARLEARVTLGGAGPALVALDVADRMHLEGALELTALHVEARDLIELEPRRVFIRPGTSLMLRSVVDGVAEIEVRSPLGPSRRARVSCGALALDMTRATSTPAQPLASAWVEPREAPLSVYDRPLGRLLERGAPGAPIEAFETQNGFRHVILGRTSPSCDAGLVIDGWVSVADVREAAAPPDSDDACSTVRDLVDVCPRARVARATELFVTPAEATERELPGRRVGLVEPGVYITPSIAGAWATVSFDDQMVTAPRGMHFIVARAAISEACRPSERATESGCPCLSP
ncbi:MAG: hypothetical protein U0271_08760 [Polyangiaceae bacterium]